MGMAHNLATDSVAGREYTDKALAIYKKHKNAPGLKSVYFNLGVSAEYENQLAVANRYFNQALKYSRLTKDTEREAMIYCKLASLATRPEAEDSLLQQDLKLAQIVDSDVALGMIYLNLSEQALDRKDYSRALGYLKEAELYTGAYPEETTNAIYPLYLAARIYDARGEYAGAYESMRHYNDGMIKTVELLITRQHKYGLMVDSVLTLTGARPAGAWAGAPSKTGYLWMWIAISAIVALAACSGEAWRQRSLRRKSEEITLHAEKELAETKEQLAACKTNVSDLKKKIAATNDDLLYITLHYLGKHRLIGKVADQLRDAGKLDSAHIKSALKLCVANLSRLLPSSSDDKVPVDDKAPVALIEGIQQLADTIAHDCPSLSPDAVELAVWLRLGFSTRNISDTTGKKLDTLAQARYRLRKALNIEQNQDLTAFLRKKWSSLPAPLNELASESPVGKE